MLKKLMKHELKATYRTFLPIYLGLAIITGVVSLAMTLLDKIDSVLTGLGFGFSILILVLGFIFVIMSPYLFMSMRFYRTTATREAYLTFTVPADTKTILLAKFLIAFMWTIVTVVLWLLAFGIVMAVILDENVLGKFFNELFSASNLVEMVLEILSSLVSIAGSILTIFAAISLSQLVRDHRVLASFGFYAAIYTVQQILGIIVLIPFILANMDTINSVNSGDSAEFSLRYSTAPFGGAGMTAYVVTLLLYVGISVACYFLSNYMLKKKLNLL